MGVKIKLYLGGPCTERASKEIESDAIKQDISLQQSLINWFSHYFNASLKYKDSGRNFYDIMLALQLGFIYGDRVSAGPLSPKVSSDFYVQAGYKYPVIILHGEMATLKEGTDPLLFTKAIKDQKIYYDPGIKVENISAERPAVKRRSQFRIKLKDIAGLYKSVVKEDVNNLDR